MGNAFLQCVKQCSLGDPTIKVMKKDEQILKYGGPIYVEDISCNYPYDAIFHSDSFHHFGGLCRPLGGFRDKKPSIDIIPSPSQDGVVRLKLMISKKEISTLMSESTNAMTMVKSIVTSLLTEMEAGNPPKASYFSSLV
ncbi:hypothetical protein SUGI_1191120 [Cryptomeria japonica]|nr:hypothetical protein SUGI_1191120 [Cryptomeria japonica]